MTALILLVGVILVVVAIHNTQGTLFGALATDVPAFLVWGAAIVAVAAIGYVPGLKTPSRWLLALVLVVLVLHNYQAILAGFQGAVPTASGGSSGGTSQTSAPTSSLPVLSSLLSIPSSSPAAGGNSAFASSEAA